MTYLVTFGFNYLACVVWYHSGRKRSVWARLRDSRALRSGGYALGVCLSLTALSVAAAGQGWERGVPLWLGIITVSGMVSLLLAVTRPKLHLWSSPVVLSLSAIALGWGGAI